MVRKIASNLSAPTGAVKRFCTYPDGIVRSEHHDYPPASLCSAPSLTREGSPNFKLFGNNIKQILKLENDSLITELLPKSMDNSAPSLVREGGAAECRDGRVVLFEPCHRLCVMQCEQADDPWSPLQGLCAF